MERESFESHEIAKILNSSFIPIKIDREERPDIDAIYMNYVQATTGSGGWPLNVFVTPDLEPVFGGTYWPGPENSMTASKSDTVGFIDIICKMRDVWSNQESRCRESAKEITRQLREFAEEGVHSHNQKLGNVGDGDGLEIDLLEDAYLHFKRKYDKVNGGFASAPKFPTPVNLKFLLNLGQWPDPVKQIVGEDECTRAAAMGTYFGSVFFVLLEPCGGSAHAMGMPSAQGTCLASQRLPENGSADFSITNSHQHSPSHG